MTLDGFLVWDAPDQRRWQLVDGQPMAMAPPSPGHAVIQSELAALIRNHLLAQGGICRAATGAGNPAETWINLWSYTTIPTVQEIAVIHSMSAKAQFLRRNADGTWPDTPEMVGSSELELASIGFRTPLAGLYAGTWLTEGPR